MGQVVEGGRLVILQFDKQERGYPSASEITYHITPAPINFYPRIEPPLRVSIRIYRPCNTRRSTCTPQVHII